MNRMNKSQLETRMGALSLTLALYSQGKATIEAPGLVRAELRTLQNKLAMGLYGKEASQQGGCAVQTG